MVQSYNPDFFLPTFIFFLIGCGYYIFKMYYTYTEISSGILNNNSQRNQNNEFRQNQSEQRQAQQEDRQAPISEPEKSQEEENLLNEEEFELIFQISKDNKKISVKVKKNQTLIHIFENKISKEINFNEALNKKMFIFMGKKVDQFAKIKDISVSDKSIIHLFISDKSEEERNQFNNSSRIPHNQSQRSTTVISEERRKNGVYYTTLKTHGIILIFFLIFLQQYKQDPNILPKNALILLQILAILWALAVSQVISKLIVYKMIIYDEEERERSNFN